MLYHCTQPTDPPDQFPEWPNTNMNGTDLWYSELVPLTDLHTYSMEQNPSWEANRFSASQEIPRIYGTQRFITAFTSARHLSLFWVSSIQSKPPHITSWRPILILSSHLRLGLPSGLFPSGFPTKTLYTPLLSPHTRYMPYPSHFIYTSSVQYMCVCGDV